MTASNAFPRRLSILGTVLALLLGLTVAVALPAQAVAPPPGIPPVEQRPATNVTADVLPTVQIDGVVWDQKIVGNTVYAGGEFANARPAGAAAGTNLTPRSNLLAYDLTTGALNTSFNPSVNSKVRRIAVSPDKSRIYVGGTFTTASGQPRSRIAAYSTSTGALISTFAPSLNSSVNVIVATDTAVYVGGLFSAANGVARSRLAAFNPTNGALLGWNPSADNIVQDMVMAPGGSKLIVGGQFQNINGSPAYGLAAVDAATGAWLPWAATNSVQNAGPSAGIFSLSTDGKSVFGTGWVFGPGGNLEGTFSADPATGSINWIEDCHGDTYGAYSDGVTVYTVSHAHYCSTVGGFPQTQNWADNMRHAIAFTADVKGTVGANIYGGYKNWQGSPAPAMINWFPNFAVGNFTGQGQAAWSISGNGKYVVAGGEFPGVNNVGQQGIVRFAVPGTAPSTDRPRLSGTDFLPSLVGLGSGRVRVAWQANHDRDDLNITYKVFRNNGTVPVYTTTVQSTYWNRPTLGFIDQGLTPGATYQYKVWAYDADGNIGKGSNVTIVAPSGDAISNYALGVLNDNGAPFWRLGDPVGSTTSVDLSGFNDARAGTGVSRGAAGAIIGDSDTASTFDGTTNGSMSTSTPTDGPNTFAVEAWIKTTTSSGGKIIGFGNAQTGDSGSYDRHVYMDNSGRIWFGVYPGGVRTVNSTASFNDGQWHHVVASLGPNGMQLYVDSSLVGSRTDVISGQQYTGYWRVGGDNLSGWTNQPGSKYFAGTIDDVALYSGPLTRQKVDAHWVASGRASKLPSAPADAYGAAVFNANPDLYWRLGEATGSNAQDSGPNLKPGVYRSGVTLGAAGAIAGTSNSAAGFNGTNGLLSSSATWDSPSTYTEQLWFKTTTASGGKLIGFGDQASTTSGNYDRHVYMETSGQLTFGVWTGQANTITSPNRYNDGNWHQMVATQSADGMKLYVDGSVVGTNPQTQAQPYTGYWKVGGDVSWNGTTYFAGTIDEVAVYSRALTDTEVAQQYSLGSTGTVQNRSPVASFTATKTGLSVSFDGSPSSDPDGTISSYLWEFGDGGSPSSAEKPVREFPATGTYSVSLTVTDDGGKANTTTQQIAVTQPQPEAAFVFESASLKTTFDASTSAAPVGTTIAGYSWDFGDGSAPGTGITPAHDYPQSGTYAVKLTVTDSKGGSSTVTQQVSVSHSNPVVDFDATKNGLTLSFDGSATSTADSASITAYAWDFGDSSAAGSGVSPTRTYAAPGTYEVTLTVTDSLGGTATIKKSFTVASANQVPTADFTSAVSGQKADFDGSGSAAVSPATITSYSWDFGDGSPAAAGATASRTYAAAGTYQVKLTVTDSAGGTASVTKPVVIAQAAVDTFARSVSSGWGAADQGGSWTLTGGASNFSVGGGTGRMVLPTAGALRGATLGSLALSDSDTRVSFASNLPATGSGIYFNVTSRRIGTTNTYYNAKTVISATGKVTLTLARTVSNTETMIRAVSVPGLATYTPGDYIKVRFVVTGSGGTTSLQAKAWPASQSEPTAWTVTGSDSTAALQPAGAIGVIGFLTGSATNAPVTLSVKDLVTVVPTG